MLDWKAQQTKESENPSSGAGIIRKKYEVCVCECVCVYTSACAGACTGQKRALIIPELESQAIVSCPTWMLGTEFWSSPKQPGLFATEPSPAPGTLAQL